ncbi:MAG TPA: NAD(P)/FAD-dependent oxidoreductase [Candidatus Eremiobacteraceae bacterium]|nr:NAD(P)/FAD-dependent oxidoreductase [Candidatus Eremiobacteraceae bacterium]
MARSGLTDGLRRAHAAYLGSAATGLPVDEVDALQEQALSDRRTFLAGAGAALAAAALRPTPAFAGSAPRVVIVGAGLGGLTCAYRLHQAGVKAAIYEANSGVGGRTWTLRDYFDDGQIAENGGEFISSEHASIRALAKELGLDLVDVRAAQTAGTQELYFVRGERYTYREMLADYAHVYPKIKAAADAGYPCVYNKYTPAGKALDQMSAREWIERNIPGGTSSKIGWLLDIDATTENGGEADKQSSLELIGMLGYMPSYNPRGGFYLVGTDERYCVKGGNDQIAARLASALPDGTVHTNSALVALRRRSDGSYVCTFESQMQSVDVAADHVILALPFTTLRRVDLSRAGFDALKMRAIRELPLGTNTKIYMQFTSRPWLHTGYNGFTYADTGYQQTLDSSRGQAGDSGILEFYSGGVVGASHGPVSFAPASAETARKQLAGLEPLYPGITKAWNGKAFLDYWTGDRWHKGSYSYWAVGQCTGFAGYERARQSNVHFCGEHTAVNFQGFMNGAVATGEAAADEILGLRKARNI